jgi:hypothetical protein
MLQGVAVTSAVSPSPCNAPIPLAPGWLAARGREETEKELRRIVCSVKFELMEAANAVRLQGPEMSYHSVDPFLPGVLKKFKPGMTVDDILHFHSKTPYFDLCFEDSWTGYFMAERFHRRDRDGLVLVHLDDHTDMMATLLCPSNDLLIDPTSGASFNPASSSDWKAAIYSGAVNIGNYITPFYYSDTPLHVRHINNLEDCGELFRVERETKQYDLIPNKTFADIRKTTSAAAHSVGTCQKGSNPVKILSTAPRGWTMIHIDLDYFINDFNGASRGESYVPDPQLRTSAIEKMNSFFAVLHEWNPTVDGWMIATSPGFCSAYHWEWLLTELEQRIRKFGV